MRVLLDENLDWRLRRILPGHQVESVAYLGWSGMKNGTLLRRAVEEGFEVMLTMDGNMLHQQDIPSHNIAVIALRAPTNRLADTSPLMPEVLARLTSVVPGTVTFVGV